MHCLLPQSSYIHIVPWGNNSSPFSSVTDLYSPRKSMRSRKSYRTLFQTGMKSRDKFAPYTKRNKRKGCFICLIMSIKSSLTLWSEKHTLQVFQGLDVTVKEGQGDLNLWSKHIEIGGNPIVPSEDRFLSPFLWHFWWYCSHLWPSTE